MDDADPRHKVAPRGPLPRRHIISNLLDEPAYQQFLSDILASETRFGPGEIQSGHRPSQRTCLTLPLPPSDAWYGRLIEALSASAPDLFERLGIKPVAMARPELEISAYNDGAFFVPHIDTRTGEGPRSSWRIISGVYYLHRQPKPFEGGELRVYRFGSNGEDGEEHVDFTPTANSCIFFPSWALHEVRPVRSTGRFEDSRFAVNIWLHGRPGGHATT